MPYAGDKSCTECWETLKADDASQLIDVRTSAEWNFVGFPVLESIGKELILVEWQQYPTMQVNSQFVEQAVAQLESAGAATDADIFMLCRSGVRSIAAAETLTAAGYNNVYNVLCGFEGNPDEVRHRGCQSGWKSDGFPWAQN
ncbi:MAG: rhodanese-like domain-containing protein [Pseudomonadota bacterium]